MKAHHKISLENLHHKTGDLLEELGKLPMSSFSDELARHFYEVRRALELTQKTLLSIEEEEAAARKKAKEAKV